MKSLTAAFIFIMLPALGFSQNFSGEKVAFHPDPFKTYMLKAKNPCTSHDYKSRDNRISENESGIYEQKTGSCRDYLDAIDRSKSDRRTVPDRKVDPIKPYHYYIIGGGILVLTVGFVILLN